MKKQTTAIIKLIMIGGIIGFLLILNTCIGGKLDDRDMARTSAVYDINAAAGGNFSISDIAIGIPYVYETVNKYPNGTEYVVTKEDILYFKPEAVKYDAKINTQIRKIGIYDSPVFTADLSVESEFNLEILENGNGYTYKTEESFITLDLNDKSIISQPEFEINGVKYKTSFSNTNDKKRGIISFFNCNSKTVNFSTNLRVRGAGEFYLKLFSTSTNLKVTSDWISPGFQKYTYLPVAHEISEEGFTAEWNIPFDIGDSSHNIGFSYVQPINVYNMLYRAITYGFLFIIVPFIVLYLFEIFLSINLHPLHYLLCGAASIIFFLLLLSISEHIDFVIAYVISALASGLLVSFYVSSITRKIKLGFAMSFVFILMYGFLFLSLKSEDYALLIGSLFAFLILALIMFFTRKVDWSNLKKDKNMTIQEK